MKNICVIGAGYVGLVAGACFAKLGHRVACLETDGRKVAAIGRNQLPIAEPGLSELWTRFQREGRLRITADYADALLGCEFIFVAVGTPSRQDGSVDLRQVFDATRGIGRVLRRNGTDRPIVVMRSTVPVGTADMVAQMLGEQIAGGPAPPVVSNPEFLREGRAMSDFMSPARVVVGSRVRRAADAVAALYEPLGRPIVLCDTRTAEMIKYAANVFLATKISFINEIAALAERLDVDIVEVARAIGMDQRIGPSYLGAGIGWGGSCLPKDLKALLWGGAGLGQRTPLLSAVQEVNEGQPALVVSKLEALLGGLSTRTVAVWGLTFKPNCDDVRDSPSVALIQSLLHRQCHVRAYDPVGMAAAAKMLPSSVTYCRDVYDAGRGSDAVVLATDWQEFLSVDLDRLAGLVRRRVIMDARNALPPDRVTGHGFVYMGIGRRTASPDGDRAAAEPEPIPAFRSRSHASESSPEDALAEARGEL